jgi:hypothetical protein
MEVSSAITNSVANVVFEIKMPRVKEIHTDQDFETIFGQLVGAKLVVVDYSASWYLNEVNPALFSFSFLQAPKDKN